MRLQAFSLAAASILLHESVPKVDASHPAVKNFIYVVPDGFGIASQVLGRDYYNLVNGQGTVARPNSAQIGADSMVIGTVRTQASDALITDSAASATAFACGIKTYNGAIGVDDDGKPVGSILEAAHLAGYKTGLVVTSRITHATPGSYSAHVLHRDSENEIASHQIGHTHPMGSVVDLVMGGGRQHYLPTSKGGKRRDDIDLISWAKGKGYTYAENKAELNKQTGNGKLPLPFLGLFASNHLAYELDRNPEKEPSLLEMVKVALSTLEAATANSHKGYFIMIEASRVDHAAHDNDAAAHVHEVLMYNDVMAYVKDFIGKHPNTQMLSAADHETGGLTLMGNYNPTVLKKAQHSGEYLMDLFSKYKGDKGAYLRDHILPQYGLTNSTDADVNSFLSLLESEGDKVMARAIVHTLSAEGGLHWSTGGHTAADVILHGFAVGHQYDEMKRLIGSNQNNINLPKYIEKVMGLNMAKVTDALRKNGVDWIEQKRPDAVKRDVYHGGQVGGTWMQMGGLY